MKCFYISAFFAAAQVLLLCAAIYLLNRNKIILGAVLIAAKFAGYFRGAKLLFAMRTSRIVWGIEGYILGLVISAVLYLVIYALFKNRKKIKLKFKLPKIRIRR